MAVESHQAKNTSLSHLNKFYQTFLELKDMKFDGMIITGAPVEQMEFEEVGLLGGTGADHGLDGFSCDLHDLSLLGRPGVPVSFLRA